MLGKSKFFMLIEPSVHSVWVLELFSETFASCRWARFDYKTDALAN
jgi:hypothetical protein